MLIAEFADPACYAVGLGVGEAHRLSGVVVCAAPEHARRVGMSRKVDKLSTVRIGYARCSSHRLVPPGGTCIVDEHYDRPAR